MTENEQKLLELVKSLKDKIITLKEQKRSLENRCQQIQDFSTNMQAELAKIKEQNGVYQSDITRLQGQLESIQKQSQQTVETEKEAREAFVQELSRGLDDANRALED